MKYLAILLMMMTLKATADCPYTINWKAQSYCVSLEWLNGEAKSRGKFSDVNELSPYLISMGMSPNQWVYSQVAAKVWVAGEKEQTPVVIPGFRIFPYMMMSNGHHHSTRYDYVGPDQDGTYLLRRMAFHKMRGCWSLRWTTADEDLLDSSAELAQITEFVNLSEAEQKSIKELCQTLSL
ncbi:MAG: hypothetical protein KDD61_11485 [Bdellovibrionales bacterium]|nr:hypothetical protein [Bdellovibrionales bacterium]